MTNRTESANRRSAKEAAHMMRLRRSLAVLLTTAALAGLPACSQMKVQTVYDQRVDFSGYTSWAWATEEALLINDGSLNPRIYNETNEGLIRGAIERELGHRGMVNKAPDDAEAQLVLFFTVTTDKMIEIGGLGTNPYNLQWSEDVASRERTKGTLTIGVFDRASRKQVWSGWASKPLTPGEDAKVVIDAAVGKILEGFPPK